MTQTNLPLAEETPTLDVRPIPRSIRHATVIGALSAIRPGRSLDLVAPHQASRAALDLAGWPEQDIFAHA